MQASHTAGGLGATVRLVCWGTVEAGAPILESGNGVTSATLTVVPVGAVQ
jgi:hypothetical protein